MPLAHALLLEFSNAAIVVGYFAFTRVVKTLKENAKLHAAILPLYFVFRRQFFCSADICRRLRFGVTTVGDFRFCANMLQFSDAVAYGRLRVKTVEPTARIAYASQKSAETPKSEIIKIRFGKMPSRSRSLRT